MATRGGARPPLPRSGPHQQSLRGHTAVSHLTPCVSVVLSSYAGSNSSLLGRAFLYLPDDDEARNADMEQALKPLCDCAGT